MNKPPEDFIVISDKEKLFRTLEHRDNAFRAFEIFVLFMLVGLNVFSLIRLNYVAESNQMNIVEHTKQIENAVDETRARQETGLCIFSVSPTKRTPIYVQGCYDQMEKKYDVKINRFGDGIE